MSFAAAIKAFEEKANLQMNKSVLSAFEHLSLSNIKLTQNINIGGYSDGDITNNWYMSTGAPEMAVPNGPDITSSASLSRLQSFLATKPFYGKDNVVFLTNVMNYSYRANYTGWPEGQGTNGWVWAGNVPNGYGFVGKSINNLRGKYM